MKINLKKRPKEKKNRRNTYRVQMPNGKVFSFSTIERRSSFLEYYSKIREKNALLLLLKAEKFIKNMPKFIETYEESDWKNA